MQNVAPAAKAVEARFYAVAPLNGMCAMEGIPNILWCLEHFLRDGDLGTWSSQSEPSTIVWTPSNRTERKGEARSLELSGTRMKRDSQLELYLIDRREVLREKGDSPIGLERCKLNQLGHEQLTQ